jgi:ABC-type antimicrobial peptide transport system, permease component
LGIFEAYKMAIKSILSKKGRSFLTMLGVIIGVGSVITAVAFAQGSTQSITSRIEGMGTNLIQIMITGRNSNRNVTYDQLKQFSDKNSDLIAAISPTVSLTATVKVGTESMSSSIIGTNPDYETVKSRHIQSGRFLLSFDIDYKQKVALIGTANANKLFPGKDPLGQIIKINGQVFKVVGVLEEIANGQLSSDDDQIIIPVTVAQRLGKNANIRNFSVQAATPETVDKAMDALDKFLLTIFKTNTNNSAYRVINQEQMLDTLNSISSTLMVVLGGIAAISLVVGGIGIMNIMLVSVTERTREIGIRKAIGAKRRNILIQFLIEAIMLTGFGGISGILLGAVAIKIIGLLNIVQATISVTWMTVSFGISVLVGVAFGIFPAIKASKMNPIEALRFE